MRCGAAPFRSQRLELVHIQSTSDLPHPHSNPRLQVFVSYNCDNKRSPTRCAGRGHLPVKALADGARAHVQRLQRDFDLLATGTLSATTAAAPPDAPPAIPALVLPATAGVPSSGGMSPMGEFFFDGSGRDCRTSPPSDAVASTMGAELTARGLKTSRREGALAASVSKLGREGASAASKLGVTTVLGFAAPARGLSCGLLSARSGTLPSLLLLSARRRADATQQAGATQGGEVGGGEGGGCQASAAKPSRARAMRAARRAPGIKA